MIRKDMQLKDKLTKKQIEAKETAKRLLNGDYVFMDTETTGVTNNDEVVNLAFIDRELNMVYNCYFKPSIPMTPEASEVSGITDEFLADKPTILEEWDNIKKALNSRKYAIYNKSFDERMMRATIRKFSLHTYNISKEEFFKIKDEVKSLLAQYENEEISLSTFNNILQNYCEKQNVGFIVSQCKPQTMKYFLNEIEMYGEAANIDISEDEVNDMLKDAVCTMTLYDNYVGLNTWIKMEEGCHAEGIDIEQNHLADGDVTMMVELMKEIAKDEKLPSVKAVFDNILNKNPSYKIDKQNRILEDIINNVDHNFKENLIKEFPKTNEDLVKIMNNSYNYDLKLEGYNMQVLRNRFKETYNYVSQNYNYLHEMQELGLRDKTEVELYNEGYSLDEISKIKETSRFNLEGVLKQEFIQNPGCVDLSKFVDPKYIDTIVQLSIEIGDKLKPIKNYLPYEVTYFNIGIVLAYYQTGRINELKEKSKNNYFDKERRILVSVPAEKKEDKIEKSNDSKELKNNDLSTEKNEQIEQIEQDNQKNISNESTNFANKDDSFEINF